MKKEVVKQLKKIFPAYPEIKLAYLFGSQATGKVGPLSDYDFAFYLDPKNFSKHIKIKMDLLVKLTTVLKTDRIDVVILNATESPEMKYHIIQEGELIYEKEPYRVLVEPSILNEYFDFRMSLRQNGLTQAL